MPKWRLDYTLEVLNYFEDAGIYAADVLQGLRMLQYTAEGMPPEGATEVRGQLFWYTIYHLVIYVRREDTIYVTVVKPD